MSYKEPTSSYCMACYQIVHVMVLAMQKAGTTSDVFKIRQAAPQVFPIPEKYDPTG